MDQGNKQIFVVLGMARSGTSALTRGLKALSIDLGDRLTPACKWHPKGFWEDNDIVYQINEKLLKKLNTNWESLQFFETSQFADNKIQPLKENAKKLLNMRFAHTATWGFKDPRTVRLLPFWQAVFAEMQLEDKYIIALRNPLAAARSYERLTGTDIEHGLLLWIVHLFCAIEQTLSKEVIVVSFESLLQSPDTELNRIQKRFNINHTEQAELAAYTSTFINKDLKHHDISFEDLKNHSATRVVPLCVDLYNFLLQLASDQMHFGSTEFHIAWQSLKNKLGEVQPLYEYLDSLFQRKAKAEKYIRALHKSRLWKLISPLRKMDGFLRQYRIDKKDKLKQKVAGLSP